MDSVRIFVSSTCYDLGQIRRDLESFISSLGHQPIMSDSPKLSIPPGLNNIEVCKWLVRSADILVLIIGGRYGTTPEEEDRSITNIEFDTAVEAELPTYTFVHKEVWDKRSTYSSLAEMVSSGELSTDRLVETLGGRIEDHRVFEFIDHVESCQGHQWIFQFEHASEINEILKTNWSLLFHQLLKSRRKSDHITESESLLPILSVDWKTEDEAVKIESGLIKVSALPELDLEEVVGRLETLRAPQETLNTYEGYRSEVVNLLKTKHPGELGLDLSAPPENPERLLAQVTEFFGKIDFLIQLIKEDPFGFRSRVDLSARVVTPTFAVLNNGTCPAMGVVSYILPNEKAKFINRLDLTTISLTLPTEIPKTVMALLNIAQNVENFKLLPDEGVALQFAQIARQGLGAVPDLSRPPILQDNISASAELDEDQRIRIDLNQPLKHNFEWEISPRDVVLWCSLEKDESVEVAFECHADNLPKPSSGKLRIVGN